jgi:hypothetical protein
MIPLARLGESYGSLYQVSYTMYIKEFRFESFPDIGSLQDGKRMEKGWIMLSVLKRISLN